MLLTRDADGLTTSEEEVPVDLVQRGDLLKVRHSNVNSSLYHTLSGLVTKVN